MNFEDMERREFWGVTSDPLGFFNFANVRALFIYKREGDKDWGLWATIDDVDNPVGICGYKTKEEAERKLHGIINFFNTGEMMQPNDSTAKENGRIINFPRNRGDD